MKIIRLTILSALSVLSLQAYAGMSLPSASEGGTSQTDQVVCKREKEEARAADSEWLKSHADELNRMTVEIDEDIIALEDQLRSNPSHVPFSFRHFDAEAQIYDDSAHVRFMAKGPNPYTTDDLILPIRSGSWRHEFAWSNELYSTARKNMSRAEVRTFISYELGLMLAGHYIDPKRSAIARLFDRSYFCILVDIYGKPVKSDVHAWASQHLVQALEFRRAGVDVAASRFGQSFLNRSFMTRPHRRRMDYVVSGPLKNSPPHQTIFGNETYESETIFSEGGCKVTIIGLLAENGRLSVQLDFGAASGSEECDWAAWTSGNRTARIEFPGTQDICPDTGKGCTNIARTVALQFDLNNSVSLFPSALSFELSLESNRLPSYYPKPRDLDELDKYQDRIANSLNTIKPVSEVPFGSHHFYTKSDEFYSVLQ